MSAEKRGSRSAAEQLATVDELELRIDKLVAGGDGLGRFEGIPIFVPLAAPGDLARVQLTERRPSYGRAEILEILQPGPDRREPPCPYFGRCGGCDLQQIEDDAQVRLKAEAALETLRRLGGVDKPPPRLRVEKAEMWGYRQRAQLQVGEAEGRLGVGYFERGSHDLVAIDGCPILVPELEGLLPVLPSVLAARAEAVAEAAVASESRVEGDGSAESAPHPGHPRRLDLAAGDQGSVTISPLVESLPHGPIECTVGEFTYALDARAFFQVHRQLLPRLVDAVVGEDSGALAWDLYSGVGLFTLPLARRFESVTAVEGDSIASRFARNNVRRARLSNVELTAGSVERAMESFPPGVDKLVVDPPRAGLSAAVIDRLLERPPAVVVYVSCHPAALARDLKRLGAAYRLEELVVLDLFPQTGHVELVCRLERAEP